MKNVRHLKKILCVSFLLIGLTAVAQKKVYINEMSGNDKWLEIYNAEDVAVDLTGCKIQKIDEDGEEDNKGKFTILSGTSIPSKGFLYWAQAGEDTEHPEFALLPWGISPTKDVSFILYDALGNILDRFDVRTEDLKSEGSKKTVGRETDGAEKLVIFANGGTKGSSNEKGTPYVVAGNPKKIFINEMNGNTRYKWLEIYNAEDVEVDISGYRIQKIDENDEVNTEPFVIKKTKIAAKGFLYWIEQEEKEINGLAEGLDETKAILPWGISAKKNVSFILRDNDNRQLDFFEVKHAELDSEGDKSVGRKTDGASELVLFPNNGTPGASNGKGAGFNETMTDAMSGYIQSGTLILSGNVTDLSIYNISGLLMVSQHIAGSQSLDISYLPEGVYILKLSNENGIRVQKVVNN